MSESNFIFEVMENEFKDGVNVVGGLVYETIRLEDVLVARHESTNAVEFVVDEIIYFNRKLAEIDRGMTVQLILRASDGAKLSSDTKYMYRA